MTRYSPTAHRPCASCANCCWTNRSNSKAALVTALTALMAWRWLDERREALPFLASIVLFLLGYLGLVISTFPYLVPPTLTIWQTAAVPARAGPMPPPGEP